MKKIQVGNFVNVTNKKSENFGTSGVVTKVLKNELKVLLYPTSENEKYFGKSIILRKKEVEKIEKYISERESKFNIRKKFDNFTIDYPLQESDIEIPIFIIGGKNIPLDFYLKKLFPSSLFSGLSFIFKFEDSISEPEKIEYKNVWINPPISGGKYFRKTMKMRKLIPNGKNISLNFHPIISPLSKEFHLKKFSNEGESPKITFSENIFQRLPKEYLFGYNIEKYSSSTSPISFYTHRQHKIHVYENYSNLTKNFRRVFLKVLEKYLMKMWFGNKIGNYGMKSTLKVEDEILLIQKIKNEGGEMLETSNIFIFHEDWELNIPPEIKFSKKDILSIYEPSEDKNIILI